MVYGDGDGTLFQRFTRSLEVVGHELTHGVTQFEAALEYSCQPPGALNESFSDVFGSLVKQWKLKQSAAKADWLIMGAGLLARGVKGKALRSMQQRQAPRMRRPEPRQGSTARAHEGLSTKDLDDNGGVHINLQAFRITPFTCWPRRSAATPGVAREKSGTMCCATGSGRNPLSGRRQRDRRVGEKSLWRTRRGSHRGQVRLGRGSGGPFEPMRLTFDAKRRDPGSPLPPVVVETGGAGRGAPSDVAQSRGRE